MTDHFIEAHFKVDATASAGDVDPLKALEDRVVEQMARAMIGDNHFDASPLRREQSTADARAIYRAVRAMHEALSKELG